MKTAPAATPLTTEPARNRGIDAPESPATIRAVVGALKGSGLARSLHPCSDLPQSACRFAALSIAHHRASAGAQRLNEQLSAALTSRVMIEQAKGVISERAAVDLAGAFSRLRAYARNHNQRLTDVAHAAVSGTLDPVAWTPPPS